MQTLPLVCSFEDGCILTLVPVDTGATMDEVARSVAEHFVGRMLAPQPSKVMRVRLQGGNGFLPRNLRVEDAGWQPLTTIEIAYESAAPAANA